MVMSQFLFQNQIQFPKASPMQKDLKNNHSLINLSSPNSTETSFCSRQESHTLLLRRKVPPQQIDDRRRRNIPEPQTLAVKYIPLTRVANQDNTISLPISRQKSKENQHNEQMNLSSRKFQRHSERVFHQNVLPNNEKEPQECCGKCCIEQKKALIESNRRLKSINQRLQQQNQKLLALIQESEGKSKKIEQQVRQKNTKIQELNTLLGRREATCSKLHESINQKYRQIAKLQDIVNKLQKQILSSNNPQAFTPLSLESTKIINQLTSQLKYREMENHMLKKEQFDAYQLQEQIKSISKENSLLKDRLTYYIRRNRSIDADSCSSDSFSLSFSESSPLKRSGKLHADHL